jgi:hypothetical protein
MLLPERAPTDEEETACCWTVESHS